MTCSRSRSSRRFLRRWAISASTGHVIRRKSDAIVSAAFDGSRATRSASRRIYSPRRAPRRESRAVHCGMRDDRVGLKGLKQAFDEARFGPQRTLNLRETLPTAEQAAKRAELWLRQLQMARAGEVLIITGRGRGSEGGVSVVREAINALLHVLRRRGVVREFREHTAGSFVVTLAPISELWEAPRRRRDRGQPEAPAPPSLKGLDEETRLLLRNLA